MRIAFVIHTPKNPKSAVFNHYRQLSSMLKSAGHSAYIIAPEDFPSLRKKHPRWMALLYPVWVWKWLMRIADDYDIVSFHSYSGWVVNLLRSIMTKTQRLRTITDFHGLEPLFYKELKAEMKRINKPLSLRFKLIHGFLMNFLIRVSCRRSDFVMCRNSNEIRYIVNNGWAERAKILLVGNTVTSEFFIKRNYTIQAHRLLITAQWSENKGTKYLIDAFHQLVQERPELELWCVGTLVDETQVLESFPADVRNRVVVRPEVTHADIIDLGKSADIFVFPTLTEGFSLALLEAMAMGLPIVTTAVGAAGDLLNDGVSVIFVPVGDSTALAQAVRSLLDDHTLREKLGKNAAARAERYELRNEFRERLSIFQRMLLAEPLKQNSNEAIEDCSTH